MASYDDYDDEVPPPLVYMEGYEEGVDPSFEDIVDNAINWLPDPPRIRQDDLHRLLMQIEVRNPLSHYYRLMHSQNEDDTA